MSTIKEDIATMKAEITHLKESDGYQWESIKELKKEHLRTAIIFAAIGLIIQGIGVIGAVLLLSEKLKHFFR